MGRDRARAVIRNEIARVSSSHNEPFALRIRIQLRRRNTVSRGYVATARLNGDCNISGVRFIETGRDSNRRFPLRGFIRWECIPQRASRSTRVAKTMLEAARFPSTYFLQSGQPRLSEQGCQLTSVSDESFRTDNRIFFQSRCNFHSRIGRK